MATTYDKASLVMIPSGYKDDKLYSVKPTDGSGDFTFSRDGAGASPATRVNASGLIEKGRENVLLQSNTFSNATWSKANSTITGGQTGYDGSSDAWLLTDDAVNGSHDVRQIILVGNLKTLSVYAKAGTLNFLKIYSGASTTYFNLSTGAVGTNGHSGASMEDVGGGWYRCSLFGSATFTFALFGVTNADNTPTYAGTGSGTIYIQDAQLEQGLVATAPAIETTTAPVSAGLLGDMPRLDYSGGATCPSLLLEPSRVNAVTQSEYLDSWGATNVAVTSNDATSPEGVTNASKLERNAAGGYISLNTSATGDQSYSIFAKAGDLNYVRILALGTGNPNVYFDLSTGSVGTETAATGSIEDYGNGWYRCTIIYNTTITAVRIYPTETDASTGGATGYVYAWGAQLESGSYPTSYIPTYGSASTRGLDAPSISSGSSIFNDNEGTFFLEIEGLSDSSSTKVVTIGDGTSNNRLQIFYQAGTNITTNLISGGSSQVTGFTTTTDQEQNHKVLIKYASNNAKMYLDGTEIASDVSVTPPSGLNVLRFNNGTGAAAFEGEVKQLLYFDTALTDAECIALTTL